VLLLSQTNPVCIITPGFFNIHVRRHFIVDKSYNLLCLLMTVHLVSVKLWVVCNHTELLSIICRTGLIICSIYVCVKRGHWADICPCCSWIHNWKERESNRTENFPAILLHLCVVTMMVKSLIGCDVHVTPFETNDLILCIP